ncbi:Hypothetical predicted protein [Pelobates cultripes]|uniref:Uncharacterized protein n=1 Tax=Pelobates cultripes TaxID=61616 RepID=A0AAD1RC46_PELCU|nr:Hypothetical predicted protein [Pelobates cultripes]
MATNTMPSATKAPVTETTQEDRIAKAFEHFWTQLCENSQQWMTTSASVASLHSNPSQKGNKPRQSRLKPKAERHMGKQRPHKESRGRRLNPAKTCSSHRPQSLKRRTLPHHSLPQMIPIHHKQRNPLATMQGIS